MGPEAKDRLVNYYMEDQVDSSVEQGERWSNDYETGLSKEEEKKLNDEGIVVANNKGFFRSIIDGTTFRVATAVAGISMVTAACSGGSHHTEATPTFDPLKTATPTSTYESPTGTPTIENKVTPPSTATATETPTQAEIIDTPEGFSPTGKYSNLEDFVEHNSTITAEQKESIKVLTADSDFAFAGDNYMVVIQKSLKTRTKSADAAGNPWAVDQLHSAELTNSNITVDGKEYNSVDAMQMAIDTAKYEAYKIKTGDNSRTFVDYLANKDLTFPLRAWDGVTGKYQVEGEPDAVVTSGGFTVIKLEGTQTDDRLQAGIGASFSYTTAVGGKVAVVGVFETNIASVGNVFTLDGQKFNIQNIQTISAIDAGLGSLSISISPDLQNQMVFLNDDQLALGKKVTRDLWPFTITQRDNKGNLIDSIVHVTGTPQILTP